MYKKFRRLVFPVLMLSVTTLACVFPALPGSTMAQHTQLASTVFILQTRLSESQTAVPVPPTPTLYSTLTATSTPSPLPALLTPQPTIVIHDSLCWLGPGPGYEVSSTILAGTQVTLLGRGIIIGWWVVENPIYHDPCWIEQYNVKVDPSVNLYVLRVYKVPSTPTTTITSTPRPSSTSTP